MNNLNPERTKGYGITPDCTPSSNATPYQEYAYSATDEELRRLGIIHQTPESSDN